MEEPRATPQPYLGLFLEELRRVSPGAIRVTWPRGLRSRGGRKPSASGSSRSGRSAEGSLHLRRAPWPGLSGTWVALRAAEGDLGFRTVKKALAVLHFAKVW